MIVAVTGATGRLGREVVSALLAAGHRPRAIVMPDDPFVGHLGTGVEQVIADVRDVEALRRAFAGADAVIHLAAVIRLAPDRDGRMAAINVQGTANMCAAARANGVSRVVHCSSHHALERFPLSEPLHEERPLALTERCDYHRSKAQAEQIVLEQVKEGLNAVIVSPGSLMGPGDHEPSLLGRSLRDLALGRLPALVETTSDYVDVRDVAQAVVRALAQGRTGERYLLGGHVLDMRALAGAVARHSGRRAPRVVLPLSLVRPLVPFARLGAWMQGKEPFLTSELLRACESNSVVSHEKAERELDFSLRPFEVTLRDTLTWFEEQDRAQANPAQK